MEYEGGTTTSTGALAHETFHSWFARGIKPAVAGRRLVGRGLHELPRRRRRRPRAARLHRSRRSSLCSRDPWQRHTPGNSYADGSALSSGLASMLGVATLNALMGELYEAHKGGLPVSTARLEELLVSRSGNPAVVGRVPPLRLRARQSGAGARPVAARRGRGSGRRCLGRRRSGTRRTSGSATPTTADHPPVAGVRPGQLVPRARAQQGGSGSRHALRRDLPRPRVRRHRVPLSGRLPAVDRGQGGVRSRPGRDARRQGALAAASRAGRPEPTPACSPPS